MGHGPSRGLLQEILYSKMAESVAKTTRKISEPQPTKLLSVATDMLHPHRQHFAPESEVDMADAMQTDAMQDAMQKDWRELCLALTNESDSTKITSLAQELIEALDRGEQHCRPGTEPFRDDRAAA